MKEVGKIELTHLSNGTALRGCRHFDRSMLIPGNPEVNKSIASFDVIMPITNQNLIKRSCYLLPLAVKRIRGISQMQISEDSPYSFGTRLERIRGIS